MRNIIKLSALVCALILVLSLCACSKKPEEPAEPPATAEGGMPEITQNNDDTGDRLARVVSVSGGSCTVEYYSGDDIGDYSLLDPSKYAPTGQTEDLAIDESVSVYKIENGGWNGASAEDISENDYLVVTKNDGGVLKWLTVIR
ncbi:MAG: hypothetical protein IKE62_02575 [Oscillospiraceae bacterium]|nr:hypothetical protein [Oscillospiraceae bacterium]